MPTSDQLLAALAAVTDPHTGRDFVSTRALKNLQVNGGGVAFDVELDYPAKSQWPALRQAFTAGTTHWARRLAEGSGPCGASSPPRSSRPCRRLPRRCPGRAF